MYLLSGTGFILPLIRNLAQGEVRKRMKRAERRIVAGMTKKGMTLELRSPRDCARDAMFRLWRALIPSGDLADAVRDWQDDRVVPVVLTRFATGTTLEELVALTREAVIEDVSRFAS